MKYIDSSQVEKKMGTRLAKNNFAKTIFFLSTLVGLVVLVVLFYRVISGSIGWIDFDFLTNKLSTDPEKAGILGAIIGSFWLMVVVAPVTLILGVGTAIYLEEYAKKGKLQAFIQMNISNLASVPSIVFGLLGMTVFLRGMNLGNIVLTGGLTMSLTYSASCRCFFTGSHSCSSWVFKGSFIWYGSNKMANDSQSCVTNILTRNINRCYFGSFTCDWGNGSTNRTWNSSLINANSRRCF